MKDDEGDSAKSLKGYVSASKYRREIMAALEDEPQTVTSLSDSTGIYSSHVSNTLKQLRESGLVECINPDRRKGKLFALTDKGQELSPKISVRGAQALESKVAETLDELSISYARNTTLKAGGHMIAPDFTILEGFEPRMLMEVKIVPDDAPEGLREYAFTAEELKKEMGNLKVALVLGGPPKKAVAKSEARSFIEGDYFDAVLHEEDLDCIREKELNLEKLLKVEKYCADWSFPKEG